MVKLEYDLQSGICDFYSGKCCDEWAIENGVCDAQNNFTTCGYYDGGDCIPPNVTGNPLCPYNPELIGDSKCLDHYNITGCDFDGGDCCVQSMIGDRVCQSHNNFETCDKYDGGDCMPPDNFKENVECPHHQQFIGDGICDNHLR